MIIRCTPMRTNESGVTGQRYDLATLGRGAANTTFSESHATPKVNHLIIGMDLTPLVADDQTEDEIRIRQIEPDCDAVHSA
jgi:hypothetical protein